MRIYLDVCSLNRPFDDQTQDRIHLESEAVVLILKHVRIGDWEWISSEVVDYEVGETSDIGRKQKIGSLIRYAAKRFLLDTEIINRALEIEKIDFGAYDALHLACAEYGNVDVFLTTDDRLLRLAFKKSTQLKVKVDNPLIWMKEVI